MPQLQGPTDADAFRDLEKGVGRVYVDPLPGDEIAPATEDWWPSISAIKKVEGKDWTATMVKRMANVSADEWHRIADLPVERRKAAMWEVNQHDLSVAAGRGTIIHWWGEDLLNGRPMRQVDPDVMAFEKIPAESLEIANQYKKALDDFFRTYDPELYAAEYVAIHRTLNGRGYGGTPDGIWRLRKTVKGLFAFDYKTRAFDSNHGAYPDEAAQVAAGVNAEYMIVSDGNGGAKRARLPELDGGMIVSIKPDGARVYPVNLEAGMRDFTELHARWVLSKSNRPKSIGRVWPVVRAPEVTGADVLAKIASAQSADELYALYRAHGSVWTDQHTAAAAARKAELA